MSTKSLAERVESRLRSEWPGTVIPLRYGYVKDTITDGGATDTLIKLAARLIEEERGNSQKPSVLVTTAEELDALDLDAVVVDFAGCPRMKRAGNSHMSGGWTHGGSSPLTARELADGHPMTVIFAGRASASSATTDKREQENNADPELQH